MVHHVKSHRTRGLAAIAAATAALTALGTTGVAQATGGPDARPVEITKKQVERTQDADTAPALQKQRTRTWFVQFKGASAADVAARGTSAVKSRRGAVERQAGSALATARAKDGKAARVFTISNTVPGVAISTNGAGAAALAKRADVVSVKAVVPKTATNANIAVLENAVKVWRRANGLGQGVKVGIIDTGLDYTHANFGGPGTVEAYEGQDSTSASWRGSLPNLGKAKIKGGFDFAGDDYQANPTLSDGSPNPDYQPTPHPDRNPLDCNGHGSHVGGTAAGYGVTPGGKTFNGNYARLNSDRLAGMKVGPGMAPAASLYGLKVFGCDGSTDVVMPALDWALDPNGDGNFRDKLDIVNMSLGSPFGPVDDPQNLVVNELAKHGVLSVNSAGNEGDVTDVGGSPGTSASALTVASSVDAYQILDGLKVNAPEDVAGTVAGQFSVAYDWANEEPVTGDVVKMSDAANADGCDPFGAADAAAVAGKVVWLTWDSNDSTRRCGSVGRSANASAAGAVGAIFTGDVSPFTAGITGSDVIPVFQLTKSSTDQLDPAAEAGTLNVTFDGELAGAQADVDQSISDTLSGFSSRGPHGSLGVVKPDIAAVGDSVLSTAFGTGNQATSYSGTSMAAPNAAGIAALVQARHRSWSPAQVKAALMNTAVHDVWTGPNKSGDRYAPARVGSGRIDARFATSNNILVSQPGNNGRTSVVFGVPEVPAGTTVTRVRKVRVHNYGRKAETVRLRYGAVNDADGVDYTVTPSRLRLKPGKGALVRVTMKATSADLRHQIDKTMSTDPLGIGLMRSFVSDASGHLLVKKSGKGGTLRLPVYTAAKPVSTTTATANAAGDGIDLAGEGVAQGDGAEAYYSIASVLELGATSGKTAACTYPNSIPGCESANAKAADIAAIGAGQGDGYLQFGVATHGNWANLDVTIPYVDYDTTGDGVPDYETYAENLGSGDLMVATTVNLNSGQIVDTQLLNHVDGSIDTNVWDTNVVLLPVDPELLNITAPITYTAGVFDAYAGSELEEVTSEQAYDVEAPTVAVDHALYDDQGDTTIPVAAEPGAKALVVHLHGTTGKRAEVVEFPAGE